MKITNSNGQVYDVYKIAGSNYAALARQLTETYGNFLGILKPSKPELDGPKKREDALYESFYTHVVFIF